MVREKRGKNTKVLIFLLLVIGFMFVFQMIMIEAVDCESDSDCNPTFSCDGDNVTKDSYCDDYGICQNEDKLVEECDDACYEGECVECASDSDCGGSTPYCDDNNCVECKSDSNCEGDGDGLDYCDDNNCVECASDSHCDDGEYCDYSDDICMDCDQDGDGFDSSRHCDGEDCDDDPSGDPSDVDCPSDPDDCSKETSECAICINPDASETCDGVDNDCDEEVDEGTGYCYSDSDWECKGNLDCSQYSKDECPSDKGCEVCEGSCYFEETNKDDDEGYGGTIDSCSSSAGDCHDSCEQHAEENDIKSYECSFEEYDDKCRGYPECEQDFCDLDGEDLDDCYEYHPDTACSNHSDRTSCNDGDDCVWECCSDEMCYEDSDGDGFGNPDESQEDNCDGSCPSGYVKNDGDCDDNDDCEYKGQTWYYDNDGDDYYSETSSCEPGSTGDVEDWYLNDDEGDFDDCRSKTIKGSDCDDDDSDVHNEITCYGDVDGDGYGNPDNSSEFCAESCPSGWVDNDTDCNDDSDDANPGISTEDQDGYRCDGLDNDCNGLVDAEEDYIDCCESTEDTDCPDTGTCGPDNTCVTPDAFWSKENIDSPTDSETIGEDENGEPELPYPQDGDGYIYLVYEYSGLDEGDNVEFEVREDDPVTDDGIRTVTGTVNSDGTAYAEFNFTKEDLEDASGWTDEESYPDDQESETWEFYFRLYDSSDEEVYDGNNKAEDFLNLTLDRGIDDTCEFSGLYDEDATCSDYNDLSSSDAKSFCESDECGVTDTGECEDGDYVKETCYWDDDKGKCDSKEINVRGDPQCIGDCSPSDECHLEIDPPEEDTCNPDSCTCEEGYEPAVVDGTELGYCVNASSDYPGSIGTCFYEETTTDDCSDGLLNYSWNATWDWSEDNSYDNESGDLGSDYLEDPEDSGEYRYDPQRKYEDCQSGSDVRACPAEIKVPFFNKYNVIATVLIIGIVYYFFWTFDKSSRKSKNSGKKGHKKSKKSKKKKKK